MLSNCFFLRLVHDVLFNISWLFIFKNKKKKTSSILFFQIYVNKYYCICANNAKVKSHLRKSIESGVATAQQNILKTRKFYKKSSKYQSLVFCKAIIILMIFATQQCAAIELCSLSEPLTLYTFLFETSKIKLTFTPILWIVLK